MIREALVAALVCGVGLAGLGVGLRLLALGTVNPRTLRLVATFLKREPERLRTPLTLLGAAAVLVAVGLLGWGYRLCEALLDASIYGR